jgi:hypothetical protein
MGHHINVIVRPVLLPFWEMLDFNSLPPPTTADRAISFLRSPPSYVEFRDAYLLPLIPLIFNDDALPERWSACRRWTITDADVLVPNVEAIVRDFEGCTAPVVVNQQNAQGVYGDEDRRDITFMEFADAWKSCAVEQSIYLKDFHLCLARPSNEMYETYDLFQGMLFSRNLLVFLYNEFVDDWMNAYALHNTNDDYRFLYLGSPGTSTALHHDVYLSHSWSTSICGVKRWILLAPEHAHLILHRVTHDPIPDLLGVTSSDDYPSLEEARNKALVVWQYPNETIFVPSGWYHSVTNHG